MADKELIDASVASGVAPLELMYRTVLSCSSGFPIAYVTELRINSMTLGTLDPDTYEPVTDRTVQSTELAAWSIQKACEDISAFALAERNIDFISVSCPARALLKDGFSDTVRDILNRTGVENKKTLCLCFPASVLLADTQRVRTALLDLGIEGVRTAVTGFGDDFCPVLRLCGLPFDFVLLSTDITERIGKDEKPMNSIIAYIRSLGSAVIASEVSKDVVSAFYRADCVGYLPSDGDSLMTFETALTQKEGDF